MGPNPPFTLAAPVSASEPAGEFDGNFGLFVQWYADSARFRVPVRAARTALPGTYDVEVRISYQRCNDRICLPLTTDTLRAPLTIAGAPEPGAPESGMQAPVMQAPGASEASRPTGRLRESRAARDGGEPVGWTGGGSLAQAGTQARPAPGSPAITPAGATPRNLPGEQAGQVAGYLVLGAGIVVGLLLVLLILRWLALRRG